MPVWQKVGRQTLALLAPSPHQSSDPTYLNFKRVQGTRFTNGNRPMQSKKGAGKTILTLNQVSPSHL